MMPGMRPMCRDYGKPALWVVFGYHACIPAPYQKSRFMIRSNSKSMDVGAEASVFIPDADIQWEQVEVGVRRKVIAYDERLMVVKVSFDTGGIGSIHHHHHSQITYVESGVFDIEIDGAKRRLGEGDSYYIAPHRPHGAVCIQAGVLIDTFSPMRAEFVQRT